MNSGLPIPMAAGMMPNKATSKAQFRLLQGIKHGSIAPRGSLTADKAGEMLGHQSPKGLPTRKRLKVKYPSPKK